MEWAKDVLTSLPSVVRKGAVYIKRIPGAVKVFVKTTLYKVETVMGELTREDIEQIVGFGLITEQLADDLLDDREVHIANIERD